MRKQSLYAYDYDQTYDLLWAEHIGLPVLEIVRGISNYLFSPAINYMPVCLIERYTPDNLPWAENWVDVNYELIKILSKTHLLDNPQLMGTPAGLEPAIIWNSNLRVDEFTITPIPEWLRFTNNRPNPISVSWLELAFINQGGIGIRSDSYSRQCKIFNKKSLIIKPNESYLLNPSRWLRNSLVISEPQYLQIETEEIDNLDSLLYSRLEAETEQLLTQLAFTTFRVLSSIDLSIEYKIRFENDASIGVTDYSQLGLISQIEIPTYSNPTYKDVPDWYYFASLIRADNNPWGELQDLEDKGKPVSVVWNNNTLDLKIWNLDYITFEGARSGIDDQALYFKAETQFNSLEWIWDFSSFNYRYKPDFQYWTGLLGLVNKPDNASFSMINFSAGWINSDTPKPVDNWFSSNIFVFSKQAFFGTGLHQGTAFYTSPDYLWNSATFTGRYIFIPTPNYRVNFSDSLGDLVTSQSAINACFSNWIQRHWLIKSYSGMVVFPRSQINTVGVFDDGFNYYPNSTAVQTWQDIETSFTINVFHENVNGQVLATRTIDTENDPIEVLTLTDWAGGWIYTQAMGYSREESKLVTIALEFWETEPIGKDLLTDDQVRSIVDAIQLSEEDSEAIVMPDSIRIKEIHAALQADKFANNPDDPDVLRVANLGYYVERIARVMGISVNPDGSIRSIRQSRLIPAGEEIPAGWPIGQWGRNQGGDRDGQRGGNADEDRDGTAYEVRSNRFTTNRFTGEPDKIESGGYILCENWPQLLHVLLDDLDKGLGWQEAGAMVIPDANNQGRWATYEGLNSLLAEVAYMLSDLSQNIKGGHISGLISQAVLYEVLGAIGLPYNFKSLKVDAEGAKTIHYPALEKNAPTLVDLIYLILQNISILVGTKISYYPSEEKSE